MEKAALFNLMSIIFFSIAAILLIVAVIMFIKFNIKEILNNLAGKEVQEQINEIRSNYDKKNEVRENLNKIGINNLPNDDQIKTDEIYDDLEVGTDILQDEGTSLLQSESTTLLVNETDVLNGNTDELSIKFRIIKDIVSIHTEEVI